MADNWVDDWVSGVDDALREWADEHDGESVDPRGARLLLDLMRDDLGLAGPDGLTPALLRRLLLEVFPETVVAGADEVPDILATAHRLVAFLGESGAVPAARAAELTAELDALAPRFAEVVTAADTAERQAAAEVIHGMMVAEGVDPDDAEAVERWVREFEALPEAERFARTEEYLRRAEELVVPPVRLAPEAELAAAARRSPLVAEALSGGSDRLRQAADEAGITEDAGGDDHAVLDAWLRLFDAVAVPEHDPSGGLSPAQLVQNELTGVLIHLYEQDEPTAPEPLAAALMLHVEQEYEVADDRRTLTAAVETALAEEIDNLVRWGVAETRDGGFALTPLGVWGVRELLLADGFVAPQVGELAEVPAADLVAGLTWHRHDTADEEIDGWLARRDPRDAAAELLEVMRTGTPGARNLAAAVLERVGPQAAGAVRDAVRHAPVRPYATLWLSRNGDPGAELSRAEYVWMFVDSVAGMMETAEPDEAVRAALAKAPADADMGALIDDIWRAEHPDATDVLVALGDHHPDKALAKAARTAAYKARSSRNGAAPRGGDASGSS
ncbi:hypothetical protein [Actinomadura miaoliensis]|uniref:Uncharacterized protein n=1 Tax=Actinomadura miaoliensis TaxID=430685 RepID=A0ABP7WQF2_9ACTN